MREETRLLTKTDYLAYKQCAKKIWLDVHQPQAATPPDPQTQRRFQEGQVVEKQAQTQFPAGTAVPYRPRLEEMAQLTTEAIAAGGETLFQATFQTAAFLVKVDILTRQPEGWHLIEVKSSKKYKPDEHLPDVAFQVFVLQQAGLTVSRASLMILSDDGRFPELTNLFTLVDLTEEATKFLPQVQMDVVRMQRVAQNQSLAEISIGRHCQRPYRCGFYEHCWQDVAGLTIYEVPYLKRPREVQLESSGIRYVADIPADFALGDKRATAVVERLNQQQINIDRAVIQAQLAGLVFPLYFFDFETIDYAIPVFPDCKPYQQVPFQYSCHILQADGTMTHREYLHTDRTDPRLPLAEAILADIGETGHVVAYNMAFERGVLRHLAETLPQHADRLLGIAGRLWDQWPIFRKHYQDYRFGKSTSLKAVLPVLAPELSYQLLAVQNGVQAQVVWSEMILLADSPQKQQMVDQLLAYCHLDTLAMVRIHEALLAL